MNIELKDVPQKLIELYNIQITEDTVRINNPSFISIPLKGLRIVDSEHTIEFRITQICWVDIYKEVCATHTSIFNP